MMPSQRVTEMVAFVQEQLAARADADKAVEMAAYMRTDMPFYGVQRTSLDEVERAVRHTFPIHDREEYRASIDALWSLPHREEKYLAIRIARHERKFVG